VSVGNQRQERARRALQQQHLSHRQGYPQKLEKILQHAVDFETKYVVCAILDGSLNTLLICVQWLVRAGIVSRGVQEHPRDKNVSEALDGSNMKLFLRS
jgi:hypothetical protein